MTDALPSIELAFVLGLRHGFAPDHLAAVDGLTMRARRAAAPWMGALFSIGHGAILLLTVGLAGLAASWLQPGKPALAILDLAEWLPGVFLLGLAAVNTLSLLRRSVADQPSAVAAVPAAPRLALGPLSALGMGMLFALGVESALQAVAWAYAAAAAGGSSSAALQVAGAFVLGMTVTDAADGYATARLAGMAGPQAIQAFRRRLGWPIVLLCLGSGIQALTFKACQRCAPDESWMFFFGTAIAAMTALFYVFTLLRSLRSPAE